jgi:hypothetical protein
MSRIIKDLNSFSQESELNEEFNWGNLFSGILDFGGEGLRKTVKEKIAALLLEKIGISEDSVLSGLIQQIVDAIPIKDYSAIITGEKANVDYLAPKMVQAMQEFIERKGFDPIAEKLGIEPKGWLYGIIINGFQSPEGKARLEKMLIDAFGGENAKGSVFRDAISELPKTEKDKISGEVEKKLTTIYGKQPGQQMEAPQDGKFLVDFWKSFSETK